jgi:hypothetical protein
MLIDNKSNINLNGDSKVFWMILNIIDDCLD